MKKFQIGQPLNSAMKYTHRSSKGSRIFFCFTGSAIKALTSSLPPRALKRLFAHGKKVSLKVHFPLNGTVSPPPPAPYSLIALT